MTGVVKVWDIRDPSTRPVFDTEKADMFYKKRQIRSLVTRGDVIYWGDDGANIKVLDLASGKDFILSNRLVFYTKGTMKSHEASIENCQPCGIMATQN